MGAINRKHCDAVAVAAAVLRALRIRSVCRQVLIATKPQSLLINFSCVRCTTKTLNNPPKKKPITHVIAYCILWRTCGDEQVVSREYV